MDRSDVARWPTGALAVLTLAACLSLPPCLASAPIQRRVIVKMRGGREVIALSAAEAAALAAAPAPPPAAARSSNLLPAPAMRSIPVLARSSIIPDLVAALGSRQGAHCNEGCIRSVHITPDCQPCRCNLLQRGSSANPTNAPLLCPAQTLSMPRRTTLCCRSGRRTMPCLGRVPLEPGCLGGIGLWEPRRELAALLDRRRVWPLWHTPLSSETACRKQWAMQAVGAEAAWDLSVGGRASTAAFAPSSTPGPPHPPSSLPGMAKGLDSGRKSISTDSVTVCVVDSGESQLGRAGAARAARALSCACCPCQGSGPPSTCQPLRWTPDPLLQASTTPTPSWLPAFTRWWAPT